MNTFLYLPHEDKIKHPRKKQIPPIKRYVMTPFWRLNIPPAVERNIKSKTKTGRVCLVTQPRGIRSLQFANNIEGSSVTHFGHFIRFIVKLLLIMIIQWVIQFPEHSFHFSH